MEAQGGGGMNIKKATFTDKEREEIGQAFKQSHPNHVYKRVLALKLKAMDGMRSDETAKISGLGHATVNQIVNRYKAEGIEAIVGKRHNHGNRYMTLEEEKAFLSQFQEEGEAGKVIEVTDIHLAFQKAVGHPVTRNAIYYLLKKHKWRKVMPRGRHPKKASPEAIEAYKKNHRNDPNPEKEAAEPAGDVSGRGWVWTDQ